MYMHIFSYVFGWPASLLNTRIFPPKSQKSRIEKKSIQNFPKIQIETKSIKKI